MFATDSFTKAEVAYRRERVQDGYGRAGRWTRRRVVADDES